jgi:hypothetical protein
MPIYVARRAWRGPSGTARSAPHEVDLAHDALAEQGCGPLDDAPDELVAEHAAEAQVALHELEIGVADARERDAHERALGVQLGARDVADAGADSVEDERTHEEVHA